MIFTNAEAACREDETKHAASLGLFCDQCSRPFKTYIALDLPVKIKHLKQFRFKGGICKRGVYHPQLKYKCSVYGTKFSYKHTLKAVSAQARYSKNRPVCLGTSRLRSWVCVKTRCALPKTLRQKSSKHWMAVNNPFMETSSNLY